jgi:hypothetical protein
MRRAYLVESLNLAPAEATGGATASSSNLTMTVTGKVFVLAATTAGTGGTGSTGGTAGATVPAAPATTTTAN